ncbi:MAG: hypothetical protein LBO82_04120, partial [Synergistaceae bacterium]|nr:hypothetical protein [Synergistaceae bacterium]
MLNFRLFSEKSGRKMGLLVLALSLLLAAAPRAWGGFEVADNVTEDTHYYFSNEAREVLIISADLLSGAEVTISGDGKSIAVKGSGAKLTLRDLTV